MNKIYKSAKKYYAMKCKINEELVHKLNYADLLTSRIIYRSIKWNEDY